MKYRLLLLTSLMILLSISGAAAASPNAAPAPQQDLTPPETTLDVGSPQHTELDLRWVAPTTPHTLLATDNVDAAAQLQTRFRYYRVASSAGLPEFGTYAQPFNLQGADGRYRIEFFSVDSAGNSEAPDARIEHLDSAPPLVSWSLGTPIFYDDVGQAWVTDETLNTLEGEDPAAPDGSPGAGIQEIQYEIEGPGAGPSADFTVYDGPFALEGPDGEYEIRFFATDNVENSSQTQTVQAYLDTTPPAIDIGGPYSDQEGTTFTFDASGTSDAGSGLATIDWDLDGDGAFDDETGTTTSRTYADDGAYFIGIEATDNLGHSDILPVSIDVQNANPAVSITISSVQPALGQTITLEGSFTDAGWLDTHTAVVDWGDGTTTTVSVTEENQPPEATGTFTAQHSYSSMGPYNITVTVTDDDGGAGTASAQLEVGLSTQMPGTLIAEDELMFYRFTGTTPGTWSSAQWQWTYGHGNPDYWWIAQSQGWLFLFLKTPNDAPAYDPQRPTEPWENYLTIAMQQAEFQQWFWCGIFLYDEYGRTIGHGCHPDFSPPPDGAGLLHPWVTQRIEESEIHVESILQASLP